MTTSANRPIEPDTGGDWWLALSRELAQVTVFTLNAGFTRQDAIDRLKGVVEWLELACVDEGDRSHESGQFYSDGCGMTDLPDPVFPTDYGD